MREICFSACAAMAVFLCFSALSCQGAVAGLEGGDDGGLDVPEDRVHDTDADPFGEPDAIPPGCGNGTVDPGEDCEIAVQPARECTAPCGSTGTQVCTAACRWSACEPPDEICNGADDDCDGAVDNGFECVYGEQEDCYERCGAAVLRTCEGGCAWSDCIAPPGLDCNEIILPYGEEPQPESLTMAFTTAVRYADVYFLVDTTGSMRIEVENLRTAINDWLVLELRALGPFTRVGMGFFEDYPLDPFGSPVDHSYGHLLDMTEEHARLMDAAGLLPEGSGMDLPESHVAALWGIATGDGSIQMPSMADAACSGGYFGFPCFRPEGLSIVVLISDAEFHNGPGFQDSYGGLVACPTFEAAADALLEADIRVVSVFSRFGDNTDEDYRALGLATRSVSWTDGMPLVFDVSDDSPLLSRTAMDGISTAASSIPMDVSARLRDDPSDSVDTTVFVQRIEPDVENLIEDTRYGTLCEAWPDRQDSDGDGNLDAFGSVPPGTTLCFKVLPAPNTTVPSTGTRQELTAFIDVLGDGRILLDTREIVFIVP